jgi:hypothetical protein
MRSVLVTREQKPSYRERYSQVENENLKRCGTPDGRLNHTLYLGQMARQLLDIIYNKECSDIPPLAKHYKLYLEAEKSGKLEPHVDLLTDRKRLGLLYNARLLVTFGLESSHEELIKDAKHLLSSVYQSLAPVGDNKAFGQMMMMRDVQLFQELKASHDMVEGMSHAGKEANRTGSRPKGRKR